MWLWITLGIIVVLFILMGLFWWGIKKGLLLALNAVIGFFALIAVQRFLLPDLVVNLWSTLITALFGIIGFIIVLALHLLGIAF